VAPTLRLDPQPLREKQPLDSLLKYRSEELQGLKSLCGNCKIGASAAKAVLISQAYVVAEATTYKDSRVLTQTLKPH